MTIINSKLVGIYDKYLLFKKSYKNFDDYIVFKDFKECSFRVKEKKISKVKLRDVVYRAMDKLANIK